MKCLLLIVLLPQMLPYRKLAHFVLDRQYSLSVVASEPFLNFSRLTLGGLLGLAGALPKA